MNIFTLLLSSLLHLFLFTNLASCTTTTTITRINSEHLPLLAALRKHGLSAYADFLTQYPTPEMSSCDIILYAPIDEAVSAYQAANPDPDSDSDSDSEQEDQELVRTPKLSRRANAAKSAANKNNFAVAAGATKPYSALPPKGTVIATGGGGTGGAKVAKPANGGSKKRSDRDRNGERRKKKYKYNPRPGTFVGTVTAGAGVRTKVLQEAVKFDKGIIYKVDSFFQPTTDLISTLSSTTTPFNLTYLLEIFTRLPHAQSTLLTTPSLTFLAPTQEAFTRSGLNAQTSPAHKLQAFLDAHTLRDGFLGYTPSFEEGRCYRTEGGGGVVSVFNGTHTLLSGAVVVGEDWIVENGVVQVIDKVLYPVKKWGKEPRTGGSGYRSGCGRKYE